MTKYAVLKKEIDEIRGRLGNIRLNLQRRIDEIDETIEAVESIQETIAEETEKRRETKKSIQIREIKLDLKDFEKVIGRQVRIVNPSRRDQNLATVYGVGSLYVLLKLQNGETTRRMAKNLRLIEEDNIAK